jgi:two-component system, OmpR family, response regulator MprA
MTRSILVIDDDKGLQNLLTDFLAEEGYDIHIAPDGEAALAALNAIKPNLIILDYMMPKMDGLTFIHELERRGMRQNIPILMLSANHRAQEQIVAVRVEGYLAKPFAIADLLEMISDLT